MHNICIKINIEINSKCIKFINSKCIKITMDPSSDDSDFNWILKME